MNIVTAITDVWSSVITWITQSLDNVQVLFYSDGNLTFLGVLSVIGVAIGIVLLLINVIQDFLRLR